MAAPDFTNDSQRPASEVAARADFSAIRYAMVWEDADVLLAALEPNPRHTILSIASAGDNAFALLASGARVIALDLSPAQLACVELRAAAYATLTHAELLELIGSHAPAPGTGERRRHLYARCRPALSPEARSFWDAHRAEIESGIGNAGKFERYFATFRRKIMPLIHSRARIDALLRGGAPGEREGFYARTWNTWRWRLLFHLFFSRFVMGRLGRDPEFFRYVEGSVGARILARTRHALTVLNPAKNPYLQWILKGHHTTALPFALRPENFDAIRANLGRLEWRAQSIEQYLSSHPGVRLDGCNLSDIFEYMSEVNSAALLEQIVAACNPGARLAYWNMLVPRSRPASLEHRVRPMPELEQRLFPQDKAFFYSRFVVEEVV